MVFVAAVSDSVGAPVYAVSRACTTPSCPRSELLRLINLRSARSVTNGEVLTLHSGKFGRCAIGRTLRVCRRYGSGQLAHSTVANPTSRRSAGRCRALNGSLVPPAIVLPLTLRAFGNSRLRPDQAFDVEIGKHLCLGVGRAEKNISETFGRKLCR